MSELAPAMTEQSQSEISRYLPLGLVAISVLALDQWSKTFVTSYLASLADQRGTPVAQVRVLLLGGKLSIDSVRNTGAAFGVMPNQTVLFIVIAVAIVGALIFSYHRLARGPIWLRIGMGLILGGALGNLTDRVRLGYVIDFIDLRWWPVFNLADSCIVVGVIMLMLTLTFQPGSGRPSSGTT